MCDLGFRDPRVNNSSKMNQIFTVVFVNLIHFLILSIVIISRGSILIQSQKRSEYDQEMRH